MAAAVDVGGLNGTPGVAPFLRVTGVCAVGDRNAQRVRVQAFLSSETHCSIPRVTEERQT